MELPVTPVQRLHRWQCRKVSMMSDEPKNPAPKEDFSKENFLSSLESIKADEAAAYANSGRILGELSDDRLKRLWILCCRSLADNPTDDLWAALATVELEMHLRGLDPPRSDVEEHDKKIWAQTSKTWRQMPEETRRAVAERTARDLLEYLDQRDKKRH
jgi:hypothetical protein